MFKIRSIAVRLILAISLTVAVLSYRAFVRYTWIGRGLHGARTRGDRTEQVPHCGPQRELRVADDAAPVVLPAARPGTAPLPGDRRAA